MALKKAKIPQTEWTTQGKEIADTAIPYYKQTIGQLGDYLGNVQNRLDPYLENYVNLAQASQQSDFLKNYQRAMGNLTAQNYGATQGGYSSANQRNYNDYQNYYNDLASRLYSQGVNLASNLASQEYNMLTGGLQSFDNAYMRGQPYSQNDQYNQMVDDYNKNAWTNIADMLGDVGLTSGNPWGMAIGAGLKGTAATFGKDFSAMDSLRAGSNSASANQYANNLGQTLARGFSNSGLTDIFNNYLANTKNTGRGVKTSGGISGDDTTFA